MGKTQSGLNEDLASALAYGFGGIGGLVFYVTEKENNIVRFNALQSICFFIPLALAAAILHIFIPFIGDMLGSILDIGSFIGWIYLTYSAYKGKLVKLPFIGDACWAQVNK